MRPTYLRNRLRESKRDGENRHTCLFALSLERIAANHCRKKCVPFAPAALGYVSASASKASRRTSSARSAAMQAFMAAKL
jgi:hypothetical protein